MSRKFSKSEFQVLWLTLSLAGLLWLAGFLGLSTTLIAQVNQKYLPLQKVAVAGIIQTKLQILHLKEAWQAEQALTELRLRYADLLTEVVELRALKIENQVLKKMIENTDRKLVKTIVAAPIISFAQPALGSGSEVNIAPGMMVIAQNQLLGFVTEVKLGQALITLLEHSQTQPVLAQTKSGVKGLIRGDGHQIWLLEVPPDQLVTEGETVITTGQAGVTPRLIVGTVSKVDLDPVSATQKIRLIQPTSFYELPLVEIR